MFVVFAAYRIKLSAVLQLFLKRYQEQNTTNISLSSHTVDAKAMVRCDGAIAIREN
jgi:hypothetical protein